MDRARFSRLGLAATRPWKRMRRSWSHRSATKVAGHCPVCEAATSFVQVHESARDGVLCLRCGSVPRQRALVMQLQAKAAPTVSEARCHESSPSLCTFDFMRRHVRTYRASYYWPQMRARRCGMFLNVDLQDQPFATASLDLVVTQDVLEHVPNPRKAIEEIARTLRPGGRHVFTVPIVAGRATETRAKLVGDRVEHLLPAEHHFDPITKAGALVFTSWGEDTCATVGAWGGGTVEQSTCVNANVGVPDPVQVLTFVRDG